MYGTRHSSTNPRPIAEANHASICGYRRVHQGPTGSNGDGAASDRRRILVFLAFWVSSFVLRKVFIGLGSRTDVSTRYVIKLVGRTAEIAVIVLGVLTGLGTMGLDVSALVAGLGLTGFALGFALRDVLSNFLSGLLILFFQPFRLHDYVAVAGFEGTVSDIDLRYTTLQRDGREILIPNSLLFTNGLVKGKEPPPKEPGGS